MISRLRLSLTSSAIRRLRQEEKKPLNDHLLTQDLDFLMSQTGDLIVGQSTQFDNGRIPNDHLLTQDLDFLMSQTGDLLVGQSTQFDNGKVYTFADFMLTQSGDHVVTQDEDFIFYNQTDDIAVASISTQDGTQLLTQNNETMVTEQEV